MQHFFTKIENGKILDKNIVNQISKILRGKIGDKICVLDGNGKKEICEILNIEKKFLEIKILEKNFFDKENFFETRKKINLFFVLPKSKDKFEFILQKGTELGVNEFHPIYSDFCNAKYPNKIERNNLIIQEAAEQSERIFLPELKEFGKFSDIFNFCHCEEGNDVAIQSNDTEKEENNNLGKNSLNLNGNSNIAMDCHVASSPQGQSKNFYFFDSRLFKEGQKNKSQFDLIKNSSYGNEVNLIIGPEGGFSENEAELARENNCEFLTLGENILRLETAIICAISRIS